MPIENKKSKHPKMEPLLIAIKEKSKSEAKYLASLYVGLTLKKTIELVTKWGTRSRKRIYAELKEAGYVRNPKKVKVK